MGKSFYTILISLQFLCLANVLLIIFLNNLQLLTFLLDFAQENRGIFEGKVVHLGSCSTFKTDKEQILKYKSLTKALMVTGYQKNVEMTESFIFEAWLLNSLYKHPDYRAKRLMDLANKEMKFFVDRYDFIAL